jgi:hypothetical protein
VVHVRNHGHVADVVLLVHDATDLVYGEVHLKRVIRWSIPSYMWVASNESASFESEEMPNERFHRSPHLSICLVKSVAQYTLCSLSFVQAKLLSNKHKTIFGSLRFRQMNQTYLNYQSA